MGPATSLVCVAITELLLSGGISWVLSQRSATVLPTALLMEDWRTLAISRSKSPLLDIVLPPRNGQTTLVIVSKQKYHGPLRVIETVCLIIFVDVLYLLAGDLAWCESALMLIGQSRPTEFAYMPIFALASARNCAKQIICLGSFITERIPAPLISKEFYNCLQQPGSIALLQR